MWDKLIHNEMTYYLQGDAEDVNQVLAEVFEEAGDNLAAKYDCFR